MTKFLAALGATVLVSPAIFALIIGVLAWRAWWLYPAWDWYIVPLGAPHISFWHCAAFIALTSALTHQTQTRKDSREYDWGAVAALFMSPMVTWLVLWWMKP